MSKRKKRVKAKAEEYLSVGHILRVLRKIPAHVPVFISDENNDGEVPATVVTRMLDTKDSSVVAVHFSGEFVWKPQISDDEELPGEDEMTEEDEIRLQAALSRDKVRLNQEGHVAATIKRMLKDAKEELPVIELDCVNYEQPYLAVA